jgi:mannitol/fructose-specific phosphotransferase system IIA component (Ntr-type)
MSLLATKPARDEQEELRQQVEQFLVVAHELPAQGVAERIDAVERVASFLAEVLLPHADLEERVLYPQAARLLHERDASGDVAIDRSAVRYLLAQLVAADAGDAGALQEVLYALYALLSAHFWRAEAMFVRLAALPDEADVAELAAAAAAR